MAAYRGSPLLLNYEPSELGIENTGHYAEVPIPAGVNSTLLLNGDLYPLVQYHFHVPAEHAVNGRLADLEAHLVTPTRKVSRPSSVSSSASAPIPTRCSTRSCSRRPRRRAKRSAVAKPARLSCS